MVRRSSSCSHHRQTVCGLILAAGGSTRMGQPKALLSRDGHPMIVHHIVAMMDTCQTVRVVVGAHAEQVLRVLPPTVEVVENLKWAETDLAASIRLGVSGWALDTQVLVTPVDTAPAPDAVLQKLIAHGAPAVVTHKGQDGHPVLTKAGRIHEALRSGTLREALANAARVDVDWVDATATWNTPEQWREWNVQSD